jgi:predicted dehydrogenase
VKLLVVGCGSIGKRHLANLGTIPGVELMACDINPERAQEVGQELGVETFNDFTPAMQRKPEAVLVCTPTSQHMDYALAAVRGGCHVFIEKPLSHTMEGVPELVSAVNEKRLVTLIGCNFRFHWGLRLVRKMVAEGKIGKLLFARAEFGQYLPDWHPWEDYRQGYSAQKSLGGGIVLDSIHEIDYLYWLLGDVGEVYCLSDKISDLEIDVEDIAEITLRFKSGTIAQVHVDYLQRAYNRCCKLVGTGGVITWSFQDNTVGWYSAEAGEWQTFRESPSYDTNEMYVEEMKHFVRCLSGEESPEVGVSEGRRLLEIALAAKKSSETSLPVML